MSLSTRTYRAVHHLPAIFPLFPLQGAPPCPQLRRAALMTMSTNTTGNMSSDPSSSRSPFLRTSTERGTEQMLRPEASAAVDAPQVAARPPQPPLATKPAPKLRATKAAITLTPTAVQRLKNLLVGPTPQLIRIGVRNKGCAGMSYHLEYVEKPDKFDEVVEQDGVRVLIDSKALFSIIGSEMDWKEDRLSSKFAFKNPNVKDACGCGESFSLGS